MSETTGISWTDHTFNPVHGCAKVSPACDHCYAERDSKRFAGGQVLWGVDAARRTFGDKHWNEPLRWNAKAAKEGVRRRVFCASMADVFDKNWPDGTRDRLWRLIEATPHLDWLLLTKRIGNARAMLPDAWLEAEWPGNARLGITVINQEEVDRDVVKLLALNCPNFLSIEPMLGFVDLTAVRIGDATLDALGGVLVEDATMKRWQEFRRGIDWVIAGGESGGGARAPRAEWFQSLRDQCAGVGVPFHFKQWGEWNSVGDLVGKRQAGFLLDGVEHKAFPA